MLDTSVCPVPLQCFRILPQSGVVQPGESQQVTFTFFGHLNSIARVTVLCHVEGGPTYEVELTAEASRISYCLSNREISCGLQVPHVSPGTAPGLALMASGFLPTSVQGSLPLPAPLLALGLGSTTFEGHIWHPSWFKMAISTPLQNAGNASFSGYLTLTPMAGRVLVGML